MADTARTTTRTVTADGIGAVPVTVTERGEGRPILLLHGGAGPQSVDGFAALLATSRPARVLTPLHPGFGGTPRPDGLDSIRGLARLYVQLIDDLGLTGVTVIGNSIGGWIAAEIALLNSPRISHVVLVDAAGLRIDAHPGPDFFSLSLDQVTDLSYFRPDKFRIDLDSIPAQQQAIIAANRSALARYGGTPMDDPSLLGRLPAAAVPVLVVWGAADRMIPVEQGQAYAAAIPGAEFRLISGAGHLPQLETPDELLEIVWDFATAPAVHPDVSIVGPNDGEVAFTGPTQMRILEDGRTTSHRLGVGEITVAPHTDGPPQHRHGRHDEGFYVVSGTARFTVGEKSYDAPAGTLVDDPAGGTAHLRQPRRRPPGAAEHVHARPVRAVLPRPARHARRGPADVGRRYRDRDGPLRHRARHGLLQLSWTLRHRAGTGVWRGFRRTIMEGPAPTRDDRTGANPARNPPRIHATLGVIFGMRAPWRVMTMNRMGFRNIEGSSTDVHEQVSRMGRSWWWPAIFGVISLVAGVLALAWPGPTLIVLAVLFGIELIVWGLFRLVGAVTFGEAGAGARTLWAILGVLSLVLGFYAIRHIEITVLALGLLLGIFWLVDGVSLIISGVEYRGMPSRGWTIFSGILSIIAGLILLVWPAISILTLAILAGIWLIVIGVMQLGIAVQLRRL